MAYRVLGDWRAALNGLRGENGLAVGDMDGWHTTGDRKNDPLTSGAKVVMRRAATAAGYLWMGAQLLVAPAKLPHHLCRILFQGLLGQLLHSIE